MLYRPIGKTGMSASIVGLGTEHLDRKPYEICEEVIEAALEAEINIMDLFHDRNSSQGKYRQALKGRRDKVLIPGSHRVCRKRRSVSHRTQDGCLPTQYFENLLKA